MVVMVIYLVMCWAGLEALSPPSRACSSPAKAQSWQGLQVGSGPAWDLRSLSLGLKPGLPHIAVWRLCPRLERFKINVFLPGNVNIIISLFSLTPDIITDSQHSPSQVWVLLKVSPNFKYELCMDKSRRLSRYLLIPYFPLYLSYFWCSVLSTGYKYGWAFHVSTSVCTNTHCCFQSISLLHLSLASNTHANTLFSIIRISGNHW